MKFSIAIFAILTIVACFGLVVMANDGERAKKAARPVRKEREVSACKHIVKDRSNSDKSRQGRKARRQALKEQDKSCKECCDGADWRYSYFTVRKPHECQCADRLRDVINAE